MTISVGDRLPEATLFEITGQGPVQVASAGVFAGKTVALFGLPGAFTPTCSNSTMPGFGAPAEGVRAKGGGGGASGRNQNREGRRMVAIALRTA